MKVNELMQSPVKVISRIETVSHARKVMMREKLSRLIVVEGTKPVGTLTRRDIIGGLNNYRTRQRELDSILIEEVMRSPVITLKEDDSVIEAAQRMARENIRGLPVVDNAGDLVGIITKTDLTRYFSENYKGSLTVGGMCQPQDCIVTVHPSHSVSRAAELMRERGVDRAVVIDGNKPIGVITETDLSSMGPSRSSSPFVKRSAKGAGTREEEQVSTTRIYLVPTAEDVMTRDPITVRRSESAAAAAGMLISRDIGGMPVVDEKGELIGMVTKFDFVKILAKETKK